MSKVLIEESTLTALGDALRSKEIVPSLRDVPVEYFSFKTPNATSYTDPTPTNSGPERYEEIISIPEATNLEVVVTLGYVGNGSTVAGQVDIFNANETKNYYSRTFSTEGTYTIKVYENAIKIKYLNYQNSNTSGAVIATIYPLDASNNRISVPRPLAKNTVSPLVMIENINNYDALTLPEEAYIISGSCSWRWATTGGNWYFTALGNKLTTRDIDNFSYAFNSNNKIVRIPCTINIKNCYNFGSAFSGCSALEECPKIRGKISWSTSTSMSDMIKSCHKIVNFEDLFEPDMLDGFSTVKATSAYSCAKPVTFYECKSIRTVPTWWYKFKLNEASTAYPATSSGYSIYNSAFQYCYVIDEVLNVPVWKCTATLTSNIFASMFHYCGRLKNFTFETQSDGTPYTTEWKSQTIDLSSYVGYTSSASYVTGANAGITSAKQVKDDATYQALKDDPDWFTASAAYSRYNHDSAVATINSLPDTSATGTNTIKFKGSSGSSTDGGAINTLTEEEIAVATAKGWTVTFA